MNILKDRKNGIVKWNYDGKDIVIQNANMMYAFEYGVEMVMLQVKSQDGQYGYSIYDINGNFILSYIEDGNKIIIGNNQCIQMDTLISVQYSKKDKKIVALTGMNKDERKLLVMDYSGNVVSSILNPTGYTYDYIKNSRDTIMAVCQGNSDITKDKYGRNDWNFRIDLNNYYVEKVSITQ